jgi:hypothetical protein
MKQLSLSKFEIDLIIRLANTISDGTFNIGGLNSDFDRNIMLKFAAALEDLTDTYDALKSREREVKCLRLAIEYLKKAVSVQKAAINDSEDTTIQPNIERLLLESYNSELPLVLDPDLKEFWISESLVGFHDSEVISGFANDIPDDYLPF